MAKWQWILVLALSFVAALAIGAGLALRSYGEKSLDPHFYDDAIDAFEAEDRDNPPAPGGILFTGSSSVRLWSTLAEDMAPLRVVNRGFGGAHMSHLAMNAKRLTVPYAPSAIVIYAGDNDLGAGTGKTAKNVIEDLETFLAAVRGELANVPVYFISLKPSVTRWDRWTVMSEANAAVQAMAENDRLLHYVDIATPMLLTSSRDSSSDSSSAPDDALFRFDGLHLSKQGYSVWTRTIQPVLLDNHGEN